MIYAPDGSVTGVRHAWTFDDMFSTYALQGIEAKTKGAYSREELAPLAQTNVESLKEFGFFTFAKADGKKQKFQEPVDYFLEYKDAALTLHFTLPLRTPVKTKQLALEVFDPAFFIDFKFADKDPVKLVGAPADCKLEFQRPNDGAASAQRLDEQTFTNGAQFQLTGRCSPTRSRWTAHDAARADSARRPGARRRRLPWPPFCGSTALCMCCSAQNPFGGPRPAPPPSRRSAASFGWLLARQSEFYREISRTIRAAKSDGSAVWTLLAISFAYGIFHAAGPGHGKAVISSYLVANQETARRGIVLSFASALLQSLVAVADRRRSSPGCSMPPPRPCAGRKRRSRSQAMRLIAAFGARLVWTKGGSFIRALQVSSRRRRLASPPAPHHHHHDHGHHHHGHDHHHDHDHVHDEHCGHSHGPTPSELAGPGGWQRGLSAIFAVGLRPCSGAILVLVFALAQGLFWAGIAATFVMGLGTAITVAAIAMLRCPREGSRSASAAVATAAARSSCAASSSAPPGWCCCSVSACCSAISRPNA